MVRAREVLKGRHLKTVGERVRWFLSLSSTRLDFMLLLLLLLFLVMKCQRVCILSKKVIS